MPTIQQSAPTIQDSLNLQVHELAWLILCEMKGASKPEHAGNLFARLANIYDPAVHSEQPPPRQKEEFRMAVAEAHNWLCSHGLVAMLYESNYTHSIVTRRGQAIGSKIDFQLFLREFALNPEALHPVVRKEAWPLYARGKFDSAVFEAFKRVEIAVRKAGGFADTDLGTALMRAAFDKSKGPLTDFSLPDAEKEAIAHLFAGAIGAFKNPSSHREVDLDDPSRATELLMLASHLLRITDDSIVRLKKNTK